MYVLEVISLLLFLFHALAISSISVVVSPLLLLYEDFFQHFSLNPSAITSFLFPFSALLYDFFFFAFESIIMLVFKRGRNLRESHWEHFPECHSDHSEKRLTNQHTGACWKPFQVLRGTLHSALLIRTMSFLWTYLGKVKSLYKES